jgi:hypothetical protein
MRAGTGLGPGALVVALLPPAAIPVLIVGAAAQVPGMLTALGAFPFLFGAWYGAGSGRELIVLVPRAVGGRELGGERRGRAGVRVAGPAGHLGRSGEPARGRGPGPDHPHP